MSLGSTLFAVAGVFEKTGVNTVGFVLAGMNGNSRPQLNVGLDEGGGGLPPEPLLDVELEDDAAPEVFVGRRMTGGGGVTGTHDGAKPIMPSGQQRPAGNGGPFGHFTVTGGGSGGFQPGGV